ncbi:MAG: type VI secretion system baseplate subunit TssE [Gammaproteobacteria bacterium]|nr:type VI secretion system baseplate subunit TssE [Gammaproteobacteria bacterium]
MSQEHSLFERLQSPDETSDYKLKVNVNKAADSVLNHLRNMLNTRQGSVPTLPDYGLPDFNDIASNFPDAIFELRRVIKQSIDNYEPRLSQVKVDYVKDEDKPLSMRYEITAQLSLGGENANVWFETTLDSQGRVKVRG